MPNSMTATSSMQRLWLAALCLLVAMTLTADAGGYQRFNFFSGQDRLEAIRDGLAKSRRPQVVFQMPAPGDGMDYEVSSYDTDTLWFGFYGPALTGPIPFIKVSDLIPHTTAYDQVVADALDACEGWKREADRLLLESLSGFDDPGFFTVIDWHANRQGW